MTDISNKMKISSFLILFCLIINFHSSAKSRLIPVGEGYSKTSVNTAVFRGSSIVSQNGKQFVSFYDPEGYVILAKRNLGDSIWELKNTGYKGKVEDAHNVISLGIDGHGILHLSFDHHGDSLKYAKSIAPYSLEMSPLLPMTGIDEDDVTYPEFYSLANGDLLFAYRNGKSGNGNLLLNRYDLQNGKWERIQDILIDGENQRNAYWQLFVDDNGVIHLSWVWRESWLVETNHDICYAKSEDGGITWTKSNGQFYELPITIDTAELAWKIPQNSELINQTGMTADKNGNPYIATYWRDQNEDTPQYRLVWNNGKEWVMNKISHRNLPFSLCGGGTKMIPISRPKIVSDGKKAFYIFRDEERGSKVSIASTQDINDGEWEIKDFTNFSVDAWEPTYDINLWNSEGKLHVFVQATHQGDGEKLSDYDENSSIIYILEIE